MIELTGGKQPLSLTNPVIAAAGTVGFGAEYSKLFDMHKLGALITNPVTYKPRHPASGTRVVPLDSGILVHTGLPNLGANRVYRAYAPAWKNSPCPVIVHIAGTTPEDVAECVRLLGSREGVVALEIGLPDESTVSEVKALIAAVVRHTELPVLARLPLYDAPKLAVPAQDAGAGALVVSAPPRGVARDPLSGQMIGGRLYGPWLKPLALRAVGQVVKRVTIPVIGCGGIHNPDDARDYLEAGARAVQVDSITWVRPDMIEIIARNLGGLELTRAAGSLADEWKPGMGETAAMRAQLIVSPRPTFTDESTSLPPDLPR